MNSTPEQPSIRQSLRGISNGMAVCIVGIFVILIVAALYFARDFFLPVFAAFILALTLSPIVRFMSKRGIPSALTAFALTLLVAAACIFIIYAIAIPVADWIDRAPQIGNQLKEKLSVLKAPFRSIMDAQEEVIAATTTDNATQQSVVVQGPGLLGVAASSFFEGATTFVVSLVLMTFLLASGDLFYSKLVQAFDTMSDKKNALRMAHDIERVISRYLFTITLINISLGMVIGFGLYILDMPTPYIWGAIAAFANFIPYVGALIGLAAVTAVAVVSFDTLGHALVIAAFYFSCTVIEGQFLTPMVVGRRLELNAVAVFLAIAFWTWLWGIVGAIIAVPVLVIFKTICDQTETMKSVGNFLSAE